MAKIILMWNYHTNETEVTEYLAKALEKNLKLKGKGANEVLLRPFPENATYQYAGENLPFSDFIFNYVRDAPARKHVAQLKREHPDAIIFDLHATQDTAYTQFSQQHAKRIKKPGLWQARSPVQWTNSASKLPLLSVQKHHLAYDLEGIYAVEIPAKFVSVKPENKRLLRECRLYFGEHSLYDRITQYFTEKTDLKQTKAANYLAPIIIRKLAHLIDTKANTESGRYRKPRRPMFRVKSKKPGMRRMPKA